MTVAFYFPCTKGKYSYTVDTNKNCGYKKVSKTSEHVWEFFWSRKFDHLALNLYLLDYEILTPFLYAVIIVTIKHGVVSNNRGVNLSSMILDECLVSCCQ